MAKSENDYVYGLNTLQSILNSAPERVLALFVDSGRHDKRISEIEALAQQVGIAIHPADSRQFSKRLGEVNHQGVMAQVKPAPVRGEKDLYALLEGLERPPMLLVLDGVQDPHNLGACLRSADAAGVDAVVVPRDNACGLNATVSKVASGAAEVIPFFQVTNLARCLRELESLGIWCIGLAREAQQDLYHTDLTGSLALVLGAEGKGLRRLTADTCDGLASLPMLGRVGSLNVSVATGIALYEALRQRHG